MRVINVALNLIDEDKEQPRYNFNEESLNELAESIKEVGLLNPIKVRQIDNGRYKIIFGNRRFKACQLLNLEQIPAIISDSESELDIYLEQLTENIQREGFTPIEEAEAFNRLLNDAKFRISKKLLSSRLGKSERYISQKLDLLIFGKEVQQLIHSGKDILPNKLSEEQVLPLKNVAIEYRDKLASKVAAEQAPVKDVKRISELFLAKDISSESKEILLNRPVHQLINDWSDYEKDKKEHPAKPELKAVDTSTNNSDFLNNGFVNSGYGQLAIVKKLNALLNSVPSQHEIPEDVLSSIEEIKIANKEEFLTTVDALIDCLMGHVQEWKKVKAKASVTKLGVVKKIK
ncbi:ParB/RepB/Spo0J family partition protein [Paenibacillus algorifonticola]|uniref:ParB/RepB/Spo0J family partition protein n=1 Tax=Paenibacillus algorifonticola TaxID=684063 RepID=UPI003D269388